jgi:hypothetical protein
MPPEIGVGRQGLNRGMGHVKSVQRWAVKDSRSPRGAVVCGPSQANRYRLMMTNASMLASTMSVAATPGGS